MVANYAALPRKGHLEMLFRMIAHLKKCFNIEIVFDPSKPITNDKDVERKDWRCSEFSSTIKKERELHARTPNHRGIGLTIVGKVDADYTGDSVT